MAKASFHVAVFSARIATPLVFCQIAINHRASLLQPSRDVDVPNERRGVLTRH